MDESKGKWMDNHNGRGGNFKKDKRKGKEEGALNINDDLWLWGALNHLL